MAELRGSKDVLAVYPDEAESTEQLFQRADEAMYRAKQAGNNRVSR